MSIEGCGPSYLQGFKDMGNNDLLGYLWRRGEGSYLLFRCGDATWQARSMWCVSLDSANTVAVIPRGDYYKCIMTAVSQIDQWTPEQRWSFLLEESSANTARVYAFLRRSQSPSTPSKVLITSVSVITTGTERHLVVFVDDYHHRYEHQIVYGAGASQLLEKNGYYIGGKYRFPSTMHLQFQSEDDEHKNEEYF